MKTELRQTSRGGCCVCLCLGFNSTLLNNDPLLQTFVCLSGGGREKRERAPKHGSSGFVCHAFHCLRSIPPNLQHESKALGFPAMPSGLRFSMFSRGSWFEVVNVRSNTPSQVEARRCLPACHFQCARTGCRRRQTVFTVHGYLLFPTEMQQKSICVSAGKVFIAQPCKPLQGIWKC